MPGLRSIFFQAVLYLAYVKLCILQEIRDFTRLDQKVCADIIIIRCCIKNFQDHRQEVVEMFDERFARMWELYLCACAATFMNGIIDLHQIIFTNDINNEIPMTKWY